MAHGPEVLLAEDAIPAKLDWAGAEWSLRWLDDLDDAPPSGPGEFPLSPGDQMVRQLVQNRGLGHAVREAKRDGHLPVVAAGGCNSSLGVVSGLDDPGIGLVWFDAHADAETPETSPDGLFEGMPVSIIAGRCWKRWRENLPGFHVIPESRIVQVGLHDRAFDEPLRTGPRGVGALVDPEAVDEFGFEGAFERALVQLSATTDRVYVHIDTDVLDASVVRASKHAALGGPTPSQLIKAVRRIADTMRIEAVSFSSFDTAVDPDAPKVLIPLIAEIARIAAVDDVGAGSEYETSGI